MNASIIYYSVWQLKRLFVYFHTFIYIFSHDLMNFEIMLETSFQRLTWGF